MKNQALTTTLAVLLAVSLSAIVALVVSSEVIGAQTTADTPAAINITVPADQPVEAAPIADVITPTEDTTTPGTDPSDDDTAATNDDTVEPDAATNDDTVEPGEDPVDPGDDTVEPGDDPVGPDECVGGTIIDGVCIVNPITCLLGYDYVDGDCVFTGCPTSYLLIDGQCQELQIAIPCEEGFTRIGGLCVPILVLDPGVVLPFCPQGEHWQDGGCVPDFKVTPGIIVPGLELATDG